MKTLILHIGWPKTGSTSLQAKLFGGGDFLSDHGIAYYHNRKNLHSIGTVSAAIAAGQSIAQERDAFHGWCDQQTAPTILMSSETLATNRLEGIEEFIGPERWGAIRVVAYLRPQDEFLEGWYKQYIKWGNKLPLRQFLADGSMRRLAAYDTHLDRWAAWCESHPQGQLRVRIFDRRDLEKGNIGADFFGALGIDDPRAVTEAANVSSSRALIELYLKIPKIDRLQQINRRIVASGLPEAVGSGDLMSDEMRRQILNHYAASNGAVRARYFPHRDVLFTPKPRAQGTGEATEALRQLLLDTVREMRSEEEVAAVAAALARL